MNAWEAYKVVKGEWIEVDTVFFDDNCDAQYVYDSLVNHDGMDIDFVMLESDMGIAFPEKYAA